MRKKTTISQLKARIKLTRKLQTKNKNLVKRYNSSKTLKTKKKILKEAKELSKKIKKLK